MPGARCGTALTRLQDETERFALDKRQALIVPALGMLTGRMS